MRLYTEMGEFTLPEDFALEMKTNNPVFTSEGSSSSTFSLPATHENLEAAGRPDRLSRREAFLNNVECIMQLGAFQLQGHLIVTSCNSEEIGCCFTYNEGSLYAAYKDNKLKDILQYVKYYPSTMNMATLAQDTQNEMEGKNNPPTKFVRFPVTVQIAEGLDIILNVLEDTSDEGGISYGNIVYKARSYTKGDITVNVPEGYGLTAFPLLHHIIEVIFKTVGRFNIVRNDFSEEPFNHLVLVHPVADLMCKGNIAYKDVVPDIKLSDFINWLQDKFGAYITVNGNDVSIIILDKMLSDSPAFDLTPYIDDDLSLRIPDRKHFNIEMDTSLAPATTANKSDFLNKYGSIQEVSKVPDKTGIYLHTPTGGIYQVTKTGNAYKQKFLGYNNFPFSGQFWEPSIEETKKTEDKALGCHQGYARYLPNPYPLYLGNAVHYNTAINEEEEEQEHPLMVAWAYYRGYWTGSVTGVKSDGTVIYPGLNPEGVFSRFWRKYNTLYLNLAPDASVTVHIPADELRKLDITKPVLIEHNRAIIKSYTYTVSKDGITSGNVTLMIWPNLQNPHEV